MSVTVDEFRKDGWNVTEEGISLLKEWTELENPTFDQCLSMALNVSGISKSRSIPTYARN